MNRKTDVELAFDKVRYEMLCEDLQKEVKILNQALELACAEISVWRFSVPRYKMKDYLIQKAKGETYDNLR